MEEVRADFIADDPPLGAYPMEHGSKVERVVTAVEDNKLVTVAIAVEKDKAYMKSVMEFNGEEKVETE